MLEEGITEAGSTASFQAAGTSLRHARRADDPLLHLLLDVRLPADRRPVLGLRRRARPRLPAGRHGRPDDARRARACSTTTATRRCSPRRSRRSARTTRRSPTSWPRSSATASSACTAAARTSSTTSTLYNENYAMPALPEGVDGRRSSRGLYRFRAAPAVAGGAQPPRATSWPAARSCSRRSQAQAMLAERFGVAAEVWSATSYQQLRADALEVERWNRLHPGEPPRVPFVASQLLRPAARGPVVAVSGLHEGRAGPVAPLGARRPVACWAPTASAAATRARRCGASSRSMRPTSLGGGGRARPLRPTRCSRGRQARESLGVDAEAPYPPAG